MRELICSVCKEKFEATTSTQKYCSRKCRRENYDKPYYLAHKERARELSRKYYAANKDKYRAANRRYYAAHIEQESVRASKSCRTLRDWLDEVKTTLKCSKCGEARSVCLAFHHLDPTKKVGGATRGTISYLTKSSKSRERILAEISKCVVLCHNCHAVLHEEQRICAKLGLPT